MKRKLLVLVLALFMPCMLMLSACGEEPDNRTALTSSMLSVSPASCTYDGTEKCPTITVKIEDVVVPATEYAVTYSNNINVGIATATVTANSASEIISGSASITFTITATSTTAASLTELSAALANIAYNAVSLTGNVEIPAGSTLTVPTGKVVNCGNYSITNNGTLVNNGTITADVDSKDRLEAAYEFANEINVTADILSTNGYIGDISLIAANRSYDLSINLNNHKIEAELDFINYIKADAAYSNYGINVSIFGFGGATIGCNKNDYAILVRGDEKVNVSLSNLTLEGTDGGIYTNGAYKGGVISANSCTFIGNNNDDISFGETDGASGAYLAGLGTYSFSTCSFTGLTGYYAKSGEHNFTNCTFNATLETYAEPSYNGNGCNETGSALVVDSAAGYQAPLNVSIIGGTFNSVAGHGIEIYTTGSTAPYSTVEIIGNPNYSVVTGKSNKYEWYNVWDGSVTAISTNNAVENVITISTGAELAGLAQAVNSRVTFEGYTIKLNSDIDLANIEFTPIGYGYMVAGPGVATQVHGKSFNGIFDAQNHTIYNLNVVGTTGVGLFGLVRGTIKNLNVNTANVTGNHFVGVIAGYMFNYDEEFNGEISNCHVANAEVNCVYLNDDESGDKAGAIVGILVSANLTNCSAKNVNVKADRDAGQLIGNVIYGNGFDYSTGNTATNVVVSWNESSSDVSGYTKGNTNINNTIVGRQ